MSSIIKAFQYACAVSPVILLSSCSQQTIVDKQPKPNIILCMADDQGWGDMAYNGHPVLKTPNFDNMAASALQFDRFYSAAPVSSPTRGSVLTGRHPNRFGCFSWGHTLRPQEITVAEALRNAGYTTAHFGKWHLGPVRKDSPVNPGNSGFDEWFSSPNFYDNDPILSREGSAVQTHGESSMVTVDAAIDFIRTQSDKKQPFLAVVWFGSPHNPYSSIESELEPYSDQEEKTQHYYGEIAGMDRAFGKLRNELKTLNIDENTILWYCSDNGGVAGFSSTGGRESKGHIYEGGLRVPAILEWPARIPEHAVSNIPVNTSDIYPTLLEIAGVNMKNQPPLDGISILPLIDKKMTKRSKAIGFWQYTKRGKGVPAARQMIELLEEQVAGVINTDANLLYSNAGEIATKYSEEFLPGHAAWLDWPYKLHRINSDNNEIIFELYKLDEDPEEKDNLFVNEPEKVKSMQIEIEAWMKSVVGSLNGEDYN